MKLIEEVSIWDNGSQKKATILNAYVVNLILNQSATFYYSLNSANEDGLIGETLTQGNLSMTGEDYTQWVQDETAWNYIAKSLNLVIVGDYVAPVAEVAPIEEAVVVEEPTPKV